LRRAAKPPSVPAVAETEGVLRRLMKVIESRKGAAAKGSYTAKLFAGGVDAIAAKIREESGEVIEAAREDGQAGRAHLTHEAADLVYHLLVLLAQRGITLTEVEAELTRRFGISGLEEKAARKR